MRASSIWAVVVVAMTAGCMPGVRHIKAYSGDDLPHDQVAEMEVGLGAVLDGVDAMTDLHCGATHCQLRVLPGSHGLTVTMRAMGSVPGTVEVSKAPRTIKVTLQAGHSYFVSCTAAPPGTPRLPWGIEVVDQTTKSFVYDDRVWMKKS